MARRSERVSGEIFDPVKYDHGLEWSSDSKTMVGEIIREFDGKELIKMFFKPISCEPAQIKGFTLLKAYGSDFVLTKESKEEEGLFEIVGVEIG